MRTLDQITKDRAKEEDETIVRIWLAERGLIAFDRGAAEKLVCWAAIKDYRVIAYDAGKDRYVHR